MKKRSFLLIALFTLSNLAFSQHSIARLWNEVLLDAIRNDFARPTIHARNLFHISAAMYDAWAAYDVSTTTYFLGKQHQDYYFDFDGVKLPSDVLEARQEAISYACYRLLRYRFVNSPDWEETFLDIETLMDSLGYDPTYMDEDYTKGKPAALGNYIASRIIEFGLQDGSNEEVYFQNIEYEPVNDPLILKNPGSQDINDPNRWQPLSFDTFIDQSGNEVAAGSPSFLSPEWGKVIPFSLKTEDLSIYQRDEIEFWVYLDPGHPCYVHPESSDKSYDYKWNFSLVANWSSHLDPTDGALWDISPGHIGNLDINEFPKTVAGLRNFYKKLEGGDYGQGYAMNPKTGELYAPQIVPRGDYTRVLAEFWADGPDSETPPGHWFTILNYVNDHPLLDKRFQGEGEVLDPLEWDVKSYFLLGGAMHDAAIAAWGIKGYYDFVRPISAIRYMADQGQSTDENLPNYHPEGIPLIEGYVELVDATDPLAGSNEENVGKIKVLSWRGHDYIEDTTDVAGVGWILAENWWPYQRPTFVTPPFAGYISGHSTFSRAAAEVLTLLTGDEYFPGGMGEFIAKKNEFLVFEEGPSTDVVLQWAKYSDASDQCSLSRIWGGIHPPVDDIPGRLIGDVIGKKAFDHARKLFENKVLGVTDKVLTDKTFIYPNPVKAGNQLHIKVPFESEHVSISIRSLTGALVYQDEGKSTENKEVVLNTKFLPNGFYHISIEADSLLIYKKIFIE